MRKYHRWITIFIALPMLFIAITGLASHVTALWPVDAARAGAGNGAGGGAGPGGGGAGPGPQAQQAQIACPTGYSCRPTVRPTGPRAWVGFFHHLHSGETFGPIGTTISILSGLALVFFAFSGIWMYLQMFLNRAKRMGRKEVFWK